MGSNFSPGEAFPTLKTARELAAARNWAELARYRGSLAPEEIDAAPELAYLVSDAARRAGNAEGARELATRAYEGALRSADARLTLRALNLLGMIEFESGHVEASESWFGQLLERASQLGDDEFGARASNNLGVVANVREDRELALTAYQRALAAYERLGHTRGLAQTSYNLGISYRDLGFADEADKLYSRAVQHAEAADSEDVIALAETERALLRALSGDGEFADRLANRALERMERIGDPLGAANAIRVLGAAALSLGDYPGALAHLDTALATAHEHGDLLLLAEIQLDRGTILLETGEREWGTAAIREAAAAYEKLGSLAAAESALSLLPDTERR